MRKRLHWGLLAVLWVVLAMPVEAQSLEADGTVTEVSDDRIVVEVESEGTVSEGDRGEVFVRSTLGGDEEQQIIAGMLRVEVVTGSIVVGEIIDRSDLVGLSTGQSVSFSEGAGAEASATLAVRSSPEGARVHLIAAEGAEDAPRGMGETPVEETTVPPGRYRVRATKEGYEPAEQTVRLRPGASRTLRLSLQPREGTLVVRPDPLDATVVVDGAQMGGGTIREDVEAGTHEVRVEAEGYAPAVEEVTIQAGDTRTIEPVLSPQTGALEVTASPGEGTVFLDDTRLGETPLSTEVEAGTYEVRVTKEGYEAVTSSVTVQGGSSHSIEVDLQKPLNVQLASAHDGPVSGVTMNRANQELVVQYDLTGDEDTYEVTLQLSTDGGQSFVALPEEAVSGAVGEDVSAGSNKQIRWDPFQQFPNGIYAESYRLRVVAEGSASPGGFTLEVKSPSEDVPSFGGATLGWTGESGYFLLSYSQLNRFSAFSLTKVHSIGVRFGPVWRLGWFSVRPILGGALRGGDLVGQGGSGLYVGRSFYVGTEVVYSTETGDFGSFLTVGVSL